MAAFAPVQRKSIVLSVDAGVYDRLEARARIMNYSASRYAQLLFEAAYHARVMRERGEAGDDAELDRQVVTVFALASAGPEEIAHKTGIASATVRRIIEGWKIMSNLGASISSRDAPKQPAAAMLPAVAGDEARQEAARSAPSPASEGGGRPGTPAPSTSSARLKAVKGSAYSATDIKTIVAMYNAGDPIGAIAEAIGRPRGSIEMWISKHRDACPRRR